MPEIYITCSGVRYFANTITVGHYRQYVELMSKNDSDRLSNAMFFNEKISQEIFGRRMSLEEIGESDIVELLTAAKSIHFIMQEIIMPKFWDLMDGEPVERGKSIFDEYDSENEYEEEEQEENIWKACIENTDRVVKLAIKLLNNSYSQCLDADIIQLLEFIKFEIQTMNEK